ncbi:MAG: aromatic ring-hydroxylating dioxygenase subunit alpha [Betaproteobacteria bacterium]|nr:aromatic ring-hydroxylating dioxygenase subunit alpha [Betaproteobacteria bacterium]
MLSQEDSDLLTQTGPGTAMGKLMRRYWFPVLLSHELPEPDCPPKRVTIMNEKLVAFRVSDGSVGLFDERCPHRNASLFFGRNEEGGLRCVYHGWKFDVSGRCIDMPSEPPESNYKNRILTTAYPCEDRGGIIWAYMGPPELKPAFPELEWTKVPASHRHVTRRLQESNWFQGYEGGWDTTHLPFLHRGDLQPHSVFGAPGAQAVRDLPDVYEFVAADYGFVYGEGRNRPEGAKNWMVSLMFMPAWKSFQPLRVPNPRVSVLAWMPVDDRNCMIWAVEYHPTRPLSPEEMQWSKDQFNYIHVETLPDSVRPVRNRDNDYQVDRVRQKKSFTGIHGLGLQDSAIQESMGPVADRTREHLNRGDEVIIKVRNHLLRMLKDDKLPLPGLAPESYRVRATFFDTPRGRSLEEGLADGVGIDSPTFVG